MRGWAFGSRSRARRAACGATAGTRRRRVRETAEVARTVGPVADRERLAWETVYELGRAAPADLAVALGAQQDDAARVLDGLHRRRLVMRLDDDYVAVGGLSQVRA